MNLSQLERIVMVAKSGNITDVAQKLYISQPALSQTISTVEDEIGAPIFDRRAQPLKLTPEGEYFIHAARDILRANESMLQNIRNVRVVNVGTGYVDGNRKRRISLILPFPQHCAGPVPDILIQLGDKTVLFK